MSEISILNGYKIKDKKAVRYYNTVSDMKSDTSLKVGMHVITTGYSNINDDEGEEYYITNIQSNTTHQELLDNNLYATVVIKDRTSNNIINVKKPGHNLKPMLFNDTDETTTLQAIIDWALSNGGATIVLPVGTTKISTINISSHGSLNIKIIGQGKNSILKSITNDNSNMINITTDNEEDINNVILKDFSIIGDSEQENVTGIYYDKVTNMCEIEGLYIQGFNVGIETHRCWTLKLINNNFYQISDIALKIAQASHNTLVIGNKISYNNNTGLSISSSYNVSVENNDIEGNHGTGLILNNTRDVSILNNYIENNGRDDATNYNEISITDSFNTNILYNYINCNTVTNGILINPNSTQITISNNAFTGGDSTKKCIKANATSTTQIIGYYSNNSDSSFTNPYDFGSSSFILNKSTHNQITEEINDTMYKKLISKTGNYNIRVGSEGVVKFQLTFDSNKNPVIQVTSGTAGSETYKDIIKLMDNLNVIFRKSISFSTQQSNADITDNNCIFVSTTGKLRFKDNNGDVHDISYDN